MCAVLCFASAAARRLVETAPLQPSAAAADVIFPAILSLVAAAAVHHAPALSRFHANHDGFGAAAVCIRVAAAVSIASAVHSVRKICSPDAGGAPWVRWCVWGAAAVAAGSHLWAALLHVDSSASGGGSMSDLALLPARVLLLQFAVALLMSMLRPSLDSLCVTLSCALHLAGAVSGAVVVYAGVALLMAATCKLQVMCAGSSGVCNASSFGCGCHVWTLAVICWYGTSHAPQFSSLKVSSGFAFVSSFNWYICGASLFFETFAPVFVWAMYDCC